MQKSATEICTVGIRNPTIQNPESFEIQIFWRSDFECYDFRMVRTIATAVIDANLVILATPVCFIGHQVYVLDPRWLSSLLDKLDISC